MKRSKFSLSHYRLLTCDMGLLIPLTWFEALPGDSIQQATSALVRVSPLMAPVMHPVRVRIHHWFVPYRLIWDDWEDFITGGPDGDNASVPPYISSASITEGSLHDYLGVPPASYSPNLTYSALPFRAYDLIYNEHYRDQDLITPLTIDTSDGADSTTVTDIQNVAWEKDYFTTARLEEQKGTAVTIPLGDTAPVVSSGNGIPLFTVGGTGNTSIGNPSGSGSTNVAWGQGTLAGDAVWDETKLATDLSAATGISVNDLRLALAIQRYQEARAQYGSRYVEYLRYLGIRSSDARLQQPEYLGGGRQVIQFSEVVQTGNYSGGDPIGTLKGHGLSAMRTNRYRRFFEEHGLVMTLMSVVPKSIYAGGLHRSFSRSVKEDFFQKELQYVGEQAVLNKEAYADHSSPGGTFGYQSRYDEYRWLPSGIAGEFRNTLDHWHYARIFTGDVALNESFIEAVPTKRVNASENTHCLYVMANHSIQARRMLTKRAVNKTF